MKTTLIFTTLLFISSLSVSQSLTVSTSNIDIYSKITLGKEFDRVSYRVLNKTSSKLEVTMTTIVTTNTGREIIKKKNCIFRIKPNESQSGGGIATDNDCLWPDDVYKGDRIGYALNEIYKNEHIANVRIRVSTKNLDVESQRQNEQQARQHEQENIKNSEQRNNVTSLSRQQGTIISADDSQRLGNIPSSKANAQTEIEEQKRLEQQRQETIERQQEAERQQYENHQRSNQLSNQILDRAKDQDPINRAVSEQQVRIANSSSDPALRQKLLSEFSNTQSQIISQQAQTQATQQLIQTGAETIITIADAIKVGNEIRRERISVEIAEFNQETEQLERV
ncbi:hypothetical protein GCM10023189_40700 [Nibrella saemangeumensis]|uniref:Uncharacterized protein n=1 Tax=Nibrella saemangeumensis TaxID=1084526 RepID=A0ABP8NBG3_9BACT